MNEILEALAKDPNTIKELVEQYKPLVYSTAQEFLNVFKDIANNKELFETCATASKNEYDALIKVGFTKNQAMAILLHNAEQLKTISNNISTTNTKNK